MLGDVSGNLDAFIYGVVGGESHKDIAKNALHGIVTRFRGSFRLGLLGSLICCLDFA